MDAELSARLAAAARYLGGAVHGGIARDMGVRDMGMNR